LYIQCLKNPKKYLYPHKIDPFGIFNM